MWLIDKYSRFFLVLSFFLILLILIRYLTLSETPVDFSVFYQASNAFIQSKGIYGNYFAHNLFLYPPAFFVLFSPFVHFPFHFSFFLWILCSCVSYMVVLWLLIKEISPKRKVFFLILPFLLISQSFQETLLFGQDTILSFFTTIVSFLLSTKHKGKYQMLSGVLFSISMILKPLTAVIILYFLFQKKWKILITTIIVFFLANMVLFHNGHSYFFEYVLSIKSYSQLNAQNIIGDHSLSAILFEVFSLPKTIIFFTSLSIGILWIWLLYKKAGRLNTRISQLILFSGLLVAGNYLLFGYSWENHALFVFPYLLIFFYVGLKKRKFLFISLLGFLLTQFDISSLFFFTKYYVVSTVLFHSLTLTYFFASLLLDSNVTS